VVVVAVAFGVTAAPRVVEASPLRVCVMVGKSRAVSKDRLMTLQRTLEERIERQFEDALVPSIDCIAAGEALEVPTYKWFKPKYIRALAESAEVNVIVTVTHRTDSEPVKVVAFETRGGDVIGARQTSWGNMKSLSKSINLWLATQEAMLEE
jgi:hypothetical protein